KYRYVVGEANSEELVSNVFSNFWQLQLPKVTGLQFGNRNCRIGRLATGVAPFLVECAHVFQTAWRITSQSWQFLLQLLADGIYGSSAPFSFASILGNIATYKVIEPKLHFINVAGGDGLPLEDSSLNCFNSFVILLKFAHLNYPP